MKKPYPYPVWSQDLARQLAAAGSSPVSQQLVDKPRRHYKISYSDGTDVAYEDSPSKVVGATEDKGGAFAYYGASHAADYLLDNIDAVYNDWWYGGGISEQRWPEEARLKWYTEARKAHTKHRDTAAETGNAVHYYIEDTLRGVARGHSPKPAPDGVPEPVRQGVEAFLQWWKQNNIALMGAEIPVCHPALGYAGTVDVIGQDHNGHGVIIDWKTSKNVYPSHMRQVAAYSLAWSAMGNDPILSAYIVHLVKEGPDAGQFHVHEMTTTDLDAGEEAWIESLNLYRYTKSMEQRLKGSST